MPENTIKREIEIFLDCKGRWLTVSDIQSEIGYSRVGIRDALVKSVDEHYVVRQRVDGTYYYCYRGRSNHFIPPCTCKLTKIEDGWGTTEDCDDCPLHGLEVME